MLLKVFFPFLGVISLAAVLLSLGKKVVWLVDEVALAMNVKLVERLTENGLLKESVKVEPYVAGKLISKNKDNVPLYDVILTSDDDLALEAAQCDDVTTITIGSGKLFLFVSRGKLALKYKPRRAVFTAVPL